MKPKLRNGMLALALIGGSALLVAPAFADIVVEEIDIGPPYVPDVYVGPPEVYAVPAPVPPPDVAEAYVAPAYPPPAYLPPPAVEGDPDDAIVVVD